MTDPAEVPLRGYLRSSIQSLFISRTAVDGFWGKMKSRDEGCRFGVAPPVPDPAADSVSKVLDDDNLLAEIIVRVGFPTSLVRAALVCRRWFRQASDPALLDRFRKLHPRRLLGFYLQQRRDLSAAARFIPVLPQPPELGTVMRRQTYQYSCGMSQIIGCRNSSLLISVYGGDSTLAVHSPLCSGSERGLAVLPALPVPHFIFSRDSFAKLLSKEEGDGLSYFYVVGVPTKDATGSTVHVYVLRNGDAAWRAHLTLATDHQLAHLRSDPRAVLVDDKIYIASALSDIVVFDLTVPSFSIIHLPQGVENGTGDAILSRADDASGVYLIHAGKDLQLRIWLHKGDNWLLVDTVCLHEMFTNLRMSDCTVEDDPTAILRINHVGDYAGFVFLETGRYAPHLDVKCRTLRKVYEMPKEDPFFFRGRNYRVVEMGDIHPVMMIWPPKFPALKDDPARNVM